MRVILFLWLSGALAWDTKGSGSQRSPSVGSNGGEYWWKKDGVFDQVFSGSSHGSKTPGSHGGSRPQSPSSGGSFNPSGGSFPSSGGSFPPAGGSFPPAGGSFSPSRGSSNGMVGPMGMCQRNFVCVHWQLCDNGQVILDGSGKIDKSRRQPPGLANSLVGCGGEMFCCEVTPGFTEERVISSLSSLPGSPSIPPATVNQVIPPLPIHGGSSSNNQPLIANVGSPHNNQPSGSAFPSGNRPAGGHSGSSSPGGFKKPSKRPQGNQPRPGGGAPGSFGQPSPSRPHSGGGQGSYGGSNGAKKPSFPGSQPSHGGSRPSGGQHTASSNKINFNQPGPSHSSGSRPSNGFNQPGQNVNFPPSSGSPSPGGFSSPGNRPSHSGGSKRPGGSFSQPQQPSGGSGYGGQPSNGFKQPSSGFKQPSSGFKQPSSGFKQPSSNPSAGSPSRPSSSGSSGYNQPGPGNAFPSGSPSSGFPSNGRPTGGSPSSGYPSNGRPTGGSPSSGSRFPPNGGSKRPSQSGGSRIPLGNQPSASSPNNQFSPSPSNQPMSMAQMMGSMMGMQGGMPLMGGSCSAGTFCVPRFQCNVYDGFIIMDPNQLQAVWPDSPQVPLLPCLIPAGVLDDGVCCQQRHPIVGANGQLVD